VSYNILIVDDSAVTRKVIRKSVTMSGFRIGEFFEAADGVDALEVLKSKWVDLVFADLNMPRMNGIELIENMAQAGILDGTPVVVVTSDRNETRLAELEAKGIRTHLNKPVRPEVLRDVMREILKDVPEGADPS
jgi:two-component system chemotaxis response regulator CheY